MGLADCINQAGLVKTLEKSFKHKLVPSSDTLQAGSCVFPPFLMSFCVTDSQIQIVACQQGGVSNKNLKKETDCTFDPFLLGQGEPGTPQYILKG